VLQHERLAAISLKCVKIEEKLLWRPLPYRNSPTLSNGTIADPYGLLFPKIGSSQPQPKTAIVILSGTVKATDFTFGQYIHRVHLNKSLFKIMEKGSIA